MKKKLFLLAVLVQLASTAWCTEDVIQDMQVDSVSASKSQPRSEFNAGTDIGILERKKPLMSPPASDASDKDFKY